MPRKVENEKVNTAADALKEYFGNATWRSGGNEEAREGLIRFLRVCDGFASWASAASQPASYQYVQSLWNLKNALVEKRYTDACDHLSDVISFGCGRDGSVGIGLLANIKEILGGGLLV